MPPPCLERIVRSPNEARHLRHRTLGYAEVAKFAEEPHLVSRVGRVPRFVIDELVGIMALPCSASCTSIVGSSMTFADGPPGRQVVRRTFDIRRTQTRALPRGPRPPVPRREDRCVPAAGSRENGGVWWALNGPLILCVATFDPAEAWRLLRRLTLTNCAEAFPQFWSSYWSSADNIESSLIHESVYLPRLRQSRVYRSRLSSCPAKDLRSVATPLGLLCVFLRA